MFGMPGNLSEILIEDSNSQPFDKVSSGKTDDRIILHCDLNNFYASVECLFHPEFKGLPVAVGGSVEKRHGIILAKNQLAKSFGIKTAEPIWQAKAKCPNLVLIPPDMSKYVRYSEMVRDIYERFTDIIEPFGIDECWLDITGSTLLIGDGDYIAEKIRETVRTELGLTVSVGVSWNKIFAKLGSDMKKPDATTLITRENYKEMVWPLPVEDLLFVGRKTAYQLKRIGINTIGKLAVLDEAFLRKQFGKWGGTLWAFANGMDASPVEKNWADVKAKGIGNSMTTPHDINSYEDAKAVFVLLAESVARRLRESGLRGRTIAISLRDCDLESIERQRGVESATCVSGDLIAAAMRLLRENWHPGQSKPLRSMGIRVTNMEGADAPVQLSFFNSFHNTEKSENIEKAIDQIREKFGDDSVMRALLLKKENHRKPSVDSGVPKTTSNTKTSASSDKDADIIP
ncbi:MAG: DNA polymerase IV [Saccharofermentanales bacterium]